MQTADPALLKIIAEAIPDGILVVGGGGRIVHVNEQVESLFGYTRDELVGRPVDILIPPHLRAAHAALQEAYFRHPLSRAMGTGLTLSARRKDGSEFPAEISLSPALGPADPLAIVVVRDVTGRRALEDDRRRAEERYRLFAEHAQDIVYHIRLVP